MKTVVTVFFIELEQKVGFLFAEPKYVLAGAAAVVLMLVIVVSVSEVFQVFRTARISFNILLMRWNFI